MDKPAHPDHGCHHEYHVGGHVFHACDDFFMQPIVVDELPDPVEPADLAAEQERRRRELAQRGIRAARRQNRAGA